LTEQIADEAIKMPITNNYPFLDFYQRLILALTADINDQKSNNFCKGAFPSYKGSQHCAHNMIRSFVEAKQILERDVSPKEEDWKWGNIHVNDYISSPWSMTPLKYFFEK
jgi:hypothetical protein